VPFIIAVHASFPAKTVPEFIAYARANLGELNMASEEIRLPRLARLLRNPASPPALDSVQLLGVAGGDRTAL
jgi:hypothetical protein